MKDIAFGTILFKQCPWKWIFEIRLTETVGDNSSIYWEKMRTNLIVILFRHWIIQKIKWHSKSPSFLNGWTTFDIRSVPMRRWVRCFCFCFCFWSQQFYYLLYKFFHFTKLKLHKNHQKRWNESNKLYQNVKRLKKWV